MKIADKIDNKIVAKFNFPFGDNRFNETLQQIKKINGSVFDKSKRVWNLPLTKTAYEDLVSSGFEINKCLEDWYTDSLLKKTLKPKIEIDGLFPFQNEGVAFIEYCQGRSFIADECGCISKDAKIIVSRNKSTERITLKKLYEKFNGISGRWDLNTETFTRSLDTKTNQFKLNKIIGVIHKGIRPVHKIITKSHNIKATSDHIFFSENGEKELYKLEVGESIYTNNVGHPRLEKIKFIEDVGETEVFDIKMQSPHHNFIANGIVVHNCGKTIQTIAWLNLHRDKTPIIIVCPATIKEKWKYEIVQWSEFENKDIILLSGRTIFEIPKDKKIVIINYDVLQYWLEPLAQISPKVLVGDEIHFAKSSSAQRTKAMKILSKNIPHIIGLSGTPIENRPIEFFNALNMIRPDVFPNKFKYALKFCNAKKNQWGWDLTGSSNREELHKLLTDTVMIRRKKVDVLPQLPTKTRSLIPITIDNMKEYWEAQNDIISWIDKNEGSGKALRAIGSETLVKIVKLQQITSKGKIDSAISWIEDFIEETDEKLVVFCKFTNTIDVLKEKFKNSCVVIDGRTPTEDRMRIIDDEFVNNKEKRLFIGNIQIAVGFNLTIASNALYIEHSFKPSDHLQSEDRLCRIGAKNAVTCWYLIALNTIDEIIVNTIHKKMKIIDVIIDGASECGDEDSALDEIMKQLKASKNH